MAGWFTLFGEITDFKQRLNRFKRIFSVENVPQLNVDVITHRASSIQYPVSFKIIFWSWRKEGFPDVYVVDDSDGNVLLLCGAVTEVGKFAADFDQKATTRKILDLWKYDGDDIVNRINGSWSLVFYNAKDNIVTAFTDRFASRSVWISRDAQTWIMGNFPSSVVTMRQNTTTLDPAGLWSLFQTSRHIPGRSLYKEVFSLIAGQKVVLKPPPPLSSSLLKVSSSSERRRKEKEPALNSFQGEGDGSYSILDWYKRRYEPDYSITPREWGYRLAYALKRSAERIKRITPDPYLFLSGGLDSRIVAGAFGKSLKAVTLYTKPNMELRFTNFVSTFIGIKHFAVRQSVYWYYLDTMDTVALISSGNYNVKHAHFIIPTINICKHYPDASFLLGDLLENLNKHYLRSTNGKFFTFNPQEFPYILNAYDSYTTKDTGTLLKIFNRNLATRLQKCWIEVIQDVANSITDVSVDDADRFDTYFRWIDVSVTPTYNMISSLWPFANERNIFFDNELNDLSLQIPSRIRGMRIIHQWILWHLNKLLLLIPDSNSYLPVFISKKLQSAAKQLRPKIGQLRRNLYSKAKPSHILPSAGCWSLLHELYRKDTRYHNAVETLFNDDRVFPRDIFNFDEIQSIWTEFLQGNTNLMFDINALISFGLLNRQIPTATISF